MTDKLNKLLGSLVASITTLIVVISDLDRNVKEIRKIVERLEAKP